MNLEKNKRFKYIFIDGKKCEENELPDWLQKAELENVSLEIIGSTIVWHGGIWLCGEWDWMVLVRGTWEYDMFFGSENVTIVNERKI